MKEMEDIDAKRNARRRRILENSEKRLTKITGRDCHSELEALNVPSDLPDQVFVPPTVQEEVVHSNVNGKISGIDNTCDGTEHFLPKLLTNRANYVLLAAVLNILLILKLDHLFGKAVTIPYFLMMLGRLYNYESTREAQGHNLLYATLILCNIKPELTLQLKKFITLVHMILGDLSLYIFSFTLIHYGLFYCLHTTNVPTTTKS